MVRADSQKDRGIVQIRKNMAKNPARYNQFEVDKEYMVMKTVIVNKVPILQTALPQKYHIDYLLLAHQKAHGGINQMKKILRTAPYFLLTNIDQAINQVIKSCKKCQQHQRNKKILS